MFIYLLDKNNKEVIEFKCHYDIITVLNSMGISYYEHFPYEEAGFDDPYSFMDEYKVIKLKPDGLWEEV